MPLSALAYSRGSVHTIRIRWSSATAHVMIRSETVVTIEGVEQPRPWRSFFVRSGLLNQERMGYREGLSLVFEAGDLTLRLRDASFRVNPKRLPGGLAGQLRGTAYL